MAALLKQQQGKWDSVSLHDRKVIAPVESYGEDVRRVLKNSPDIKDERRVERSDDQRLQVRCG